jgi:hypothetical protein
MKFPVKNFYDFCKSLRVETKEDGLVYLGDQLLGTQTYLIEEISKGLEEDVHYFVILKGRQLGITTISLALDLYWHYKYGGVQGTLVTDTEDNRDMFRSTLSMYMDGLPPEFKIPAESHNRTQLVLKNRSRMVYQVAGTRKKGGLGRGKAIMFMHATETSSWGDEEGIASLEASLAEHNPKRLYLWESTARGFNVFHDMWETAKSARTQRAIFIGWWRNQFYSVKKESPIFKTYWDGRLTTEERTWTREVKQLYEYDITPEQIAWWRWKMAEVIKDETMMYQEFPPTEQYAFVMSGSQFFSAQNITDRYKLARQMTPDYYRFLLGEHFKDTELVASKSSVATLKIWETPKQGAHYVVGADPAYGSSEWADRFAIVVLRCYANKVEQVAEFCTTECNTYQYAWVLCYLAGAYGPNVMVNLEINGPGQAVWSEMLNLKRTAAAEANISKNTGLFNVLSNIQNYLYKRTDTISAAPGAYHWKTTYDTKERMFNGMKDCFERGLLTIRSTECLDEMKNVVRDNGSLGVPGRGKDDRVVAMCLATIAWIDFVRLRLVQQGVVRKPEGNDEVPDVLGKSVNNYLRAIGVQ